MSAYFGHVPPHCRRLLQSTVKKNMSTIKALAQATEAANSTSVGTKKVKFEGEQFGEEVVDAFWIRSARCSIHWSIEMHRNGKISLFARTGSEHCLL